MAESQKGAAPTSDSNRKISLLDEDFGKEFFSSWRTMSVTEDDGMDFNCETAPKGMKKNFNFDKLDMDFALDGDFGKISSFKVDMSGLDFSSPRSKERAEKESIDGKLDGDFGKISSFKVDMSGLDFSSPKSKGRAEKESIDGKLEVKKDHFNFNFDFKELNSFDLDSSLMKGKQKIEKCTDNKGSESSIRHEKDKGSRSNSAREANEFRENNIMTDSVTTSNSKDLLGGLGDFGSIAGAPTSANFETVNASGSATSSQDVNMNSRQEETNQPSPHSTKSSDQQPIQDSFGQPVSFDPRQESVSELQVASHSLEAPLDTNPGLLSTKCEIGKRLGNQNQVPMGNISEVEAVPGNAGAKAKGFQSTINEFQKKLENQNHIPMINVSGHESVLDNANSVDVSSTTLLLKMQNTKAYSLSQSLLVPVQSEHRADKVMQIEEQGNGATNLTLLSRAQEKVSQSHLTLTTMETHSLLQKRKESGHLSPTDQKRLEFHSDAHSGLQNLGTSSPKDGSVTKGVPLIKESKKNDNAQSLSGPGGPRADKVMQIEEQGNGATHLTLLNRAQENVSRSHPTLITMETHSLRLKREESGHLSPTDQRRLEFNSDAQGGHQTLGTSSPKDGTVTKGIPLKDSKKNDNDHGLSGPGSHVRDSSSHEKAAKLKPLNINPKRLVPRINSNSISVERNELSGLKNSIKTSNATSLKFTRVVTSKNDPSVSASQKEPKSLRNSNGTMGMPLDLANLKKQSISSEKQKLLSPSLKRKTFEANDSIGKTLHPIKWNLGSGISKSRSGDGQYYTVIPLPYVFPPNHMYFSLMLFQILQESTAYPVKEYPLKRITERPNHSRKAREVSQQIYGSQVHNHESHGCDKDVYFDHPMLKSDTPEQVPLSELQVPIVMENDENVKKAETCRKELEDMCNMLKKKHEEAKELLVRALVNNNNLLMLNHPMYEEKICTILRFSASLRSKELQS